MTTSGVMTVLVYKGLARSPEIENTPHWIFLNIWRLGRVRDNIFSTKVSNKKLLNASKCRVTALTVSVLLRGKRQGIKLKLKIKAKSD